MTRRKIAQLLEEKADEYNRPEFIKADPIQIPKQFFEKRDIEVSAFLTAVISWGRRDMIIKNARMLIEMMGGTPGEFITEFKPSDLKPFEKFVHRTFKDADCPTFLYALQRIYLEEEGLEKCLRKCFDTEKERQGSGWHRFKEVFFATDHLPRTRKHLPDPLTGSAAKRMNMFMRWMVRKDDRGVDFGIWESFSPAELYLPLDVHTSRTARKLGLLKRKQDDWKAVVELTETLRKIDPADPIRFDFALFGMSAFESDLQSFGGLT